MLAARYIYILALVVWLGGMIVAASIVAPATFAVLETASGVAGRVLAGQLFGSILSRLQMLGCVAGAVMIVMLTLQRIVGPRPAAYGIRTSVIVVMLAATAYASLTVGPRVDALQRAVGGPMSRLPIDDSRRQEFDGLHVRSSALLTVAGAGGLILLFWEAREQA